VWEVDYLLDRAEYSGANSKKVIRFCGRSPWFALSLESKRLTSQAAYCSFKESSAAVWCRTPRAVWTVKRPDDPRIGGAQIFELEMSNREFRVSDRRGISVRRSQISNRRSQMVEVRTSEIFIALCFSAQTLRCQPYFPYSTTASSTSGACSRTALGHPGCFEST